MKRIEVDHIAANSETVAITRAEYDELREKVAKYEAAIAKNSHGGTKRWAGITKADRKRMMTEIAQKKRAKAEK